MSQHKQSQPKRKKADELAPPDGGQGPTDAQEDVQFHLPPSLRESVYTYLKGRIIRNNILPGTVLYVERLSTELGVSRTPIREALLCLEGEHLVEGTHKQGFVVTRIERNDIEHVYQVRLLLETEAVARATNVIPDDVLNAIERVFAKAVAEMQLGQYDGYLQCDQTLHLTILEYAENTVLAQIARSLFERSIRIRYIADGQAAEHAAVIMSEHETILRALQSRDRCRAEEAMKYHLSQACARALEHLQQLQQAPS